MKKQVFAAAMMTMVTCVWAAPMRADIIEQVLVKVNGDIITKTELETRQIAALRQKMQGQQVDPAALDGTGGGLVERRAKRVMGAVAILEPLRSGSYGVSSSLNLRSLFATQRMPVWS